MTRLEILKQALVSYATWRHSFNNKPEIFLQVYNKRHKTDITTGEFKKLLLLR